MKNQCFIHKTKPLILFNETLDLFFFGKRKISFGICRSCGLIFQSESIEQSKMIKSYSIDYNTDKFKSKKNFSSLRCHLDLNLFYGLLTKKIKNWNEPTSGTLVLYERKPNRFDPNLLFSLNFLSA